jgi:membrane protease subunit HflK
MGNNPSDKQPDQTPDPWKRNVKKSEGPPDLDILLGKLKTKLFDTLANKKGGGSGGRTSGTSNDTNPAAQNIFFTLIVVVLLVIWALSGIFIVSPAERSVITRFGKYVETVGSGPHWIPRFIQSQQIVNVQRVSNYAYESQMLTKDENIVSVAVAVQYRINDAKEFLFNVVDPVRSLEQATASALRQVVGHNTLDDLLTTGRSQVREQVADQLQELLVSYKAGISVTDVTLQSVKPPEAVTAAFDDAIKAREDQQAYINKADAYSNQVLAAAQGQVARILRQADAYKQEVVLGAQAATAGYLALLPEYQAAPQVMRQRLYLTAMEAVLGQSSKVLLDQKNGNPLIYLPLDKLSASSTTTPQPEAVAPSIAPSMVAASSNVVNRSATGNASSNTASDTTSTAMDRPSYPIREETTR